MRPFLLGPSLPASELSQPGAGPVHERNYGALVEGDIAVASRRNPAEQSEITRLFHEAADREADAVRRALPNTVALLLRRAQHDRAG